MAHLDIKKCSHNFGKGMGTRSRLKLECNPSFFKLKEGWQDFQILFFLHSKMPEQMLDCSVDAGHNCTNVCEIDLGLQVYLNNDLLFVSFGC